MGRCKSHGLSTHRLYKTWKGMLNRCYNENNRAYKDYGALGISVSDEWLDITVFINDMFPTFIEGYTLDRKDVTKGCSKDNCRWASASTQSQNTRLLNSKNTSGYRGVHLCKGINKWESRIRVNSKRIYLGKYLSIIDAAKAYNAYVISNNLEHTLNVIIE